MAEAFHVASTGRPGPVLVDVAKDALQAETEFRWPPDLRPARLPPGDPAALPAGPEAARLIAGASRPVLYVGGGVIKAGAARS